MSCRLGAAAAVAGGGDDGVLQLLAPGGDGAVAPAPAAAAAPHAAAAVTAAAVPAAVAPGRRAGEVGVGLVPRLDGAVGATVAETNDVKLRHASTSLVTTFNHITETRLKDIFRGCVSVSSPFMSAIN